MICGLSLTAALVAAACSLVGCFLVLRKTAMIGDAISHSVLPGIVIAFLISGSRGSIFHAYRCRGYRTHNGIS